MEQKKRLVIGVSGASGVILAEKILLALKQISDIETHLVISDSAALTWKYEVGSPITDLTDLADYYYTNQDISAPIASGSFSTYGMIVIPCSMKTVAGIANGYSDNLLLRAADVAMKEHRRITLVVRETPFSSIHLRNMFELSKFGVTILPAVMTFYNAPHSIDDLCNSIIMKALDTLEIENSIGNRWK